MEDVTLGHRAELHATPTTMDQSRPLALRGHPAHGAYGNLQRGQNERATLALAPSRGPAHPYSHAKAHYLGHPWVPGLPGTHLGPPATTVPRGSATPQAGDTPYLPRTPPGAITRVGFLPRHVQKPPPTIRPAKGPRQRSHSRGAGRHTRAAPGEKEPWPLPAPQPHAASRSTASHPPRGYGQKPWRPEQTRCPTDIICH